MKDYLTINAFAKKAGISPPTVMGHILRGNIKTTWRKVKAIPTSELERYLSVPHDAFGRRQIKASNEASEVGITLHDTTEKLLNQGA